MSKPPTYREIRQSIQRSEGEESFLPQFLRSKIDGTGGSIPINLDPDYQRGHVWTREQAAAFVGHKLEGGESPTLTVQRWQDSTRPDEMVDGKQRFTAVLGFVEGRIPALLSDGNYYYLSDWSPEDQPLVMRSLNLVLRVRYVSCPTRADVLRLYLKLNRGGSVHTDEEIARVRALLTAETTPTTPTPSESP
jgi:hypothetical protein